MMHNHVRTHNRGIVYRSKSSKTGQIAAIKVCSRDALNVDEEMKEVDVWKNLEHKNVVNLISFELTKSHLFGVEIMNGGELFDAIVARVRRSDTRSNGHVKFPWTS